MNYKLCRVFEDAQKAFFKVFIIGGLAYIGLFLLVTIAYAIPSSQLLPLTKTVSAALSGSLILFGVSNFLTRVYSGKAAQFLERPFWVMIILAMPMWLVKYCL